MGVISLIDTITDAHWVVDPLGTIVLTGTNRETDKDIPIARIMENHQRWNAFCCLDLCYVSLPKNIPTKDLAKEEVYHHLRLYHQTMFHNIYINYPSIQYPKNGERNE